MVTPLGYEAARQVVEIGRSAFFGSLLADLPEGRHESLRKDDLTPQFGFVGSEFASVRVLLLGINPGNGPSHAVTAADLRMMPPHREFALEPSVENFEAANAAYARECVGWPVWSRHCAEVIGAGKLALTQVAYSNCLPWRTQSQSAFSEDVARKAAFHYAVPLIQELAPNVVIAMGKRAAEILSPHRSKISRMIVWNRAQAATKAVLSERAATAKKIFEIIGRGNGA